MNAESVIPMVLVPLTFLFVLLIILIAKAPKVGAWIVGGLVFAVPFLLYRCVTAGGFKNDEEVIIPLVVTPITFLFVLLMILLAKAPKAGVGLIIGIVVLSLFGLFVWPIASHRPVAYAPTPEEYPVVQVRQQAENGAGLALVVQEFDLDSQGQWSSASAQILPPQPVPPVPPVPSPIWSQGIDQELDADVYPSQAAAVRALGAQMDRSIARALKDANLPARVVVFQEGHDREFVAEFCREVEETIAASCLLESNLRNLEPGEVGVTLHLVDIDTAPASWAPDGKSRTGRIEAAVLAGGGQVTVNERFVEKPWVDAFATIANIQPDQHFVVARSLGACMSEGEAHQQALDDARAQLTQALGTRGRWSRFRLPEPEITATDVLQGGFIADRFVQSFEGSAGRIWRQALLIDVSGPKLLRLADQKAREMRAVRMGWARMGLSALGVVVLIGVIYFFLNMATMGYYEWSLRIAGVVLAIVAIISILMIIQ